MLYNISGKLQVRGRNSCSWCLDLSAARCAISHPHQSPRPRPLSTLCSLCGPRTETAVMSAVSARARVPADRLAPGNHLAGGPACRWRISQDPPVWRACPREPGRRPWPTPRRPSSLPGPVLVWPCGSETTWWPARSSGPVAARSGPGRPVTNTSGTGSASPARRFGD